MNWRAPLRQSLGLLGPAYDSVRNAGYVSLFPARSKVAIPVAWTFMSEMWPESVPLTQIF